MRVAVVIPWFGRELRGGAEQHAWEAAARLARRGHEVDVLTTCCRSHQDDWATNHLPAGVAEEPEGFRVQRFPVSAREVAAFDRVCSRLHRVTPDELRIGVSPIPDADAAVFTSELIKSPELLEYIGQNVDSYDQFIVLPYLYGPVLDAIEIVREKAAFQPCLHDEAYAYLPQIAQAFYRAGSILFISEGERQLALRLFGAGIARKSTLVGAGVELPQPPSTPEAPPAALPAERFVLYLGRKDAGKNVGLLVRAYARFRSVRPNSDLQLVLAGPGSLDLGNPSAGVHDLGLVSEAEKADLLRRCLALAQPSENESFSRVMIEAWLNGRPVAAHERCLATAVAVDAASGGWKAGEERDWARLFVEIERSPSGALDELGENGRRYAEAMADWEQVIARYEDALRRGLDSAASGTAATDRDFSINQFLPNLGYGDAISNQAMLIQRQLRSLGYRSEIYARFIDARVADRCTVFSRDALRRSDAVIYHHSIGSEITPHVVDFRGAKALVYHNITPAAYFQPYRPKFAEILRQGRDDLQTLAPSFPISIGVSAFNTAELTECGFHRPTVLPVCVDPAHWAERPDPQLMARLQDGRTNLLFVGRIAPNKKQDQLVRAFAHYRRLDPSARLSLVGPYDEDDPYAVEVRSVIRDLDLGDAVELTGSIPDAALQAYYRTARLFWSMSEHEGFCVPLVEAMWFDVPVLAFKSSAVPETLGGAGFLLTSNEPAAAAATAHQLVIDESLRQPIIAAQREERSRFLPEHGLVQVAALASQLVAAAERAAAEASAVRVAINRPQLSASKPRVAFVVQRAGREVIGGAEALCLQIAQQMSKHWETDVLTTCALDYMTWRNHYPEGAEQIDGTCVRRFPVDELRDVAHFDALSAELVGKGGGATTDEQENWMRAQGPFSTELFEYLQAHGRDYEAVFFFGYLYATTYFGLPLVEDRAVLVPLAHDEWTIHLSIWDHLFSRAAGFVFQTPEERQFLLSRFPHVTLEGRTAGIGIEAPASVDPQGFRARYGLHDPFLLYLGRIDASKGCGEMLAAFRRLKEETRTTRKLVLMGREVMPVPFDEDVVYLGSLSEEEKWNGLAACEWLLMPSAHESLSIALLEAWSVGRPAIVNGHSRVLVGHCRRSGGGLWYQHPEEWPAFISNVDAATADTLGRQGRDYVLENYRWERVAADYIAALEELAQRRAGASARATDARTSPRP
jgi:glycosyltransferase involved in cell wall biosynthesis